MSTVDRRTFLKTAAAGAGGLALAGPLQAFAARPAGAAPTTAPGSSYGPIAPAVDQSTGQELLALPAGFQYWSFSVLSGTNTSCAGGPTPWGSWLTCEETTEVQGKPHGFVYETPSSAEGFVPATPLTQFGRFVHEAVTVEPNTGIIYLTEDAGGTSGFYFNSTDGGAAAAGQVWAWFRHRGREFLELVYESPSTDALLKPDNITVSPRGGILLCEDTDRARQTFLRGVNDDGELFDLAANIRPGTIAGTTTPMAFDEFAGTTFYGDWLFVNIQTPGITFAITGPWDTGPLI